MPVHRERENMSKYSTKLLGFGDNVVDIYDHLKTMYPGGNCVNVSVYGKMAGCEKTAYMGYFGDDDRAELIMDTLEKIGVETVKCRQLHGENGYSRITLKDGDREFLDFNDGGIRGKTPYVLDRFDLEYMKGFDVVHSGNYSFTEEELHKIKEAGIPVSFDFSDDSTEEYYEKTSELYRDCERNRDTDGSGGSHCGCSVFLFGAKPCVSQQYFRSWNRTF